MQVESLSLPTGVVEDDFVAPGPLEDDDVPAPAKGKGMKKGKGVKKGKGMTKMPAKEWRRPVKCPKEKA